MCIRDSQAFLACAQIGAIWSSCSSDFGPKAIIDRFKQIEPKILMISDHYFYNNKKFDTLKNIKSILCELPSIENLIIIPFSNEQISTDEFEYTNWNEILNKKDKYEIFERFDFTGLRNFGNFFNTLLPNFTLDFGSQEVLSF